MGSDFDFLIGLIQKLGKTDNIENDHRYSVPRLGQVVKIQDDLQAGRILVVIPSLGWDSEDKGIWCYPKEKKSLITPKKDDWVVVEWLDGNRDRPTMYSAIASWMKDMLPKNYDGQPTTQIIFEDNEQETYILYNEQTKKFTLNVKDFIFEIDAQGNLYTLSDGSNKIELDKNATKIKLSGTLIDFLSATESFIKGDTLCNAFTTLCSTIAGATSGSMAQNAAGIETIKTAFSVFNGQINNFKSTTIKGE